mmetsp:Transcript_8904/g.11190  ORF Transcript_8904/g.11190 Transcript_8904/m.11190 type:complete len:81 (-) Transcript_8904:79-321(-)
MMKARHSLLSRFFRPQNDCSYPFVNSFFCDPRKLYFQNRVEDLIDASSPLAAGVTPLLLRTSTLTCCSYGVLMIIVIRER